MFPALPDKKYDIIYSDCPWDYGPGRTQHSGKKKGKTSTSTGGAKSHYNTETTLILKDLDVASIAADDCLHYMWTSSPHLDQAIDLLDHWGFDYTTIAFIWHKLKTNPGYYTLSQCEICIVGKKKKGKIPQPRGSRNERQLVEEVRGAHSAKPEEVARRITRMHPTQRKIELFSRVARDGWDVWGLEAPTTTLIEDLTMPILEV